MTFITSTDIHEKSFKIIQEDDKKFFKKLLSKETSSKPGASFRVYYGDVSSSIPFTWETIPGTPKHKSLESYDIPPLTPPPSYYANGLTNSMSSKKRSFSRSKLQLLHTLLRRINPKKVHTTSSPSASTSSSSSLSWSPSYSEKRAYPRRRRFTSWGSSFDERAAIGQGGEEITSASKMCFGIGKGNNSDKIYHNSQSHLLILKKVFLSVIGRGSD